jgi:hypothetical protein
VSAGGIVDGNVFSVMSSQVTFTVLQADAPKPELIPKNDVVGVTVLLLTCSYRDSVRTSPERKDTTNAGCEGSKSGS